MDIKIQIREFFKKNLATIDDELEIKDDADIFKEGFVDSSFAMQLVLFVEEVFNIQVTDDDLDLINFSTINRLAGFINLKRSN